MGQYYQQYMGGGSKSNTGGYQKYYQQYMSGGSQSGSSSSGSGSYQQYYQKYLGGGDSQDVTSKSGADAKGGSQKSDFDKYFEQQKKAADDSAKKSTQAKDALTVPMEFFAAMPPMMLAEVTACSTEECVKEWKKNNEANVKKHVPKE